MNAWRRYSESVRSVSGIEDFSLHRFPSPLLNRGGEHGVGDFTVIDGLLNHAASSSKTGAARAYHHARMTSARVAVMAELAAQGADLRDNLVWARGEVIADKPETIARGKESDDVITFIRGRIARLKEDCSSSRPISSCPPGRRRPSRHCTSEMSGCAR